MKTKRMAIALLLAGTAMQAQARDRLDIESAVPVAVIGTESLERNLERLNDITTLCGRNRGNPAYGVNATPGKMPEINIRGFKSEYGDRYATILNGLPVTKHATAALDVSALSALQLQRIEILQTPQQLNCEVFPDVTAAAAGGGIPPAPTPSDPALDVQALPPDVQSGRHIRTPAEVRAELDALVRLCRDDADQETSDSRIERYNRLFGELREFRAIRDDLRERLLSNDPDLNQEDAINQLRKLDPAVDGAVFPSQLKCPPTAEELAQSQSDPATLYREYSVTAGTNYLVQQAGLVSDINQPPPGNQREIVFRPETSTTNEIRPVFERQSGPGPGTGSSPGHGERIFDISVSGGLGQLDVASNQTGIGFQRTGPGTETFADVATTKFDSASLSARLTYGLDDKISLYGSYGYSEGNARSEFAIAAGGPTDVGFVYGETSPSGSTGLAIGNRGLTGFNESEFRLHEIKFGVSTPIANQDGFSAFASIFANVLLFDIDFENSAQSTVFGSVLEQSRDQSVSSNYLGIGGGLGIRQDVGPGVAITASAAGGLYYRDSDLHAMEWNSCALCPPADQNFSLEFNQSDSGTAFAGQLSAALEFDVTADLKFSIGADASYLSDTAEIINPSSGNQILQGETTRLGMTDAWRWRATAGLKLSF